MPQTSGPGPRAPAGLAHPRGSSWPTDGHSGLALIKADVIVPARLGTQGVSAADATLTVTAPGRGPVPGGSSNVVAGCWGEGACLRHGRPAGRVARAANRSL